MTIGNNSRGGRHVRIYEWDEVDINEDSPEEKTRKEQERKAATTEQPKGLGGFFKRKLF